MISSVRLTRELIDQIVFGMENQERVYWLDTQSETVIPDESREGATPPDRYIEVPQWRSVDGYNLMEQFVGTLHNPIYRGRLRSILSSGRGVFRQFKDTIRERREIERLWFTFKERRMRETVTEWFNDLREREGLERLTDWAERSETSILIETDFAFRDARDDEFAWLAELDADGFAESYPDVDSASLSLMLAHARAGSLAMDHDDSRVIVTETQGGDFAGFIWASISRSETASVAFVNQLYVAPEFRGFGLGRALFYYGARVLHDSGVGRIELPLSGAASDLEENFVRYGLERTGVRLGAELGKWRRSTSD